MNERFKEKSVSKRTLGLVLEFRNKGLSEQEVMASVIKKQGISKITKEMDALYSLFIRNRDRVCYFSYAPNVDKNEKGCGNAATQNSHYWGRGNKSVRYNDENCDGICGYHHRLHEGNKQGLYRDLKLHQLGKNGYKKLEKKSRTSRPQLDVLIDVMCRFL